LRTNELIKIVQILFFAEPNSFFHVFNVTIPAKQLAKDYCELNKILDNIGFQTNLLLGPEANHVGNGNQNSKMYLENFCRSMSENCIDSVT